ncbi:GABA permease-like protein [Aureobasidium pullulans]|uniref:GABA permease-like protein n=1 Tax=Aureobasidium pullulans TaxID=5580 RepID=A0A4S9T5R7_AURPU|nr:GABA permease-like protein [Aureobasidium pullulans]
MSMSSEENKSSAIRFGEREVGDSDNRPTRTAAAARHAQFELGDYNDSARDEESDETADVYGSVPSDKRDMMRMGKEQELRRVFRQVSLLSFTAILMATWEFVLMACTQGLVDGGRAGLFWSYIWVMIGYGFIIASLAEMSSMAPTCGGQYHWVSEFAPPSCQKFLSYITGWVSTLSWQAGNASGGFICGTLIQSLIIIKNPDYAAPGWQGTLLVFPVMLVCVVFNIWLNHWLPSMQNAVMVLHVAGFLAIMVIFWVLSPHVPAREVFLDFQNDGGWQTMGLALMIGQISAVGFLGASDAAAHMSEEVKDAGLSVPRAMWWTYIVNGLLGLIMLVSFLFAMPSVEDAINDVTGYPMMYAFQQAMPMNGTIVLTVLMMVLLMAGNISYQASTARQTYAFARDRGFPGSRWLGYVNPKLMIPVNAVIFSAVFTIILSLINIGSSAAFNAIISLGAVAQMGTYAISITCVLYRRLTAPHLLPKARWSLGRWGVVINIVGLLFAWEVFFWCFWPNAQPVTVDNFNWAPVMFVAVVVGALITYYFQGRRVYTGPVAIVQGRQEESLAG